jgi:hypothetical protein
VTGRRDIVYIGKRFWLIMTLVCALPETVFKRLRI